MNIKLLEIRDKNSTEKERIVLKVMVDSDIGRYVIFRTGKNDRGITNKVYSAYWFPDKLVKAGDLVVLYTRAGIMSENHNTDGSTTHFFYWGSSTSLWVPTCATVLISTPEWQVLQ